MINESPTSPPECLPVGAEPLVSEAVVAAGVAVDTAVDMDEPLDAQSAEEVEFRSHLLRMMELSRRVLVFVRIADDVADLTLTQIVILASLERQPMRVGELASITRSAQNTISEVVERLKRRGYVTKVRDPNDKRAVVVHLTRTGRAAIEKRRAKKAGMDSRVLRSLSREERQRFVNALDYVVTTAEQAFTDKAPAPSIRNK